MPQNVTQRNLWSFLKNAFVNTGTTNAPSYEILGDNVVKTLRVRLTIAQFNAGTTLLVALPGLKYRLVFAALTAIGGAVTGATTVDIVGTQATAAVKLMAAAVANLTQNAFLRTGDTGGAVLAAGASFVENDVNTAIVASKTGSDLATATHVDVFLTYTIVKA